MGLRIGSIALMMEAVTRLYERIADPALLIRRIYVVANHVYAKDMAPQEKKYEQISLFTDVDEQEKERARENEALQKEKRIQDALLSIRDRYGKNAVLRGMNLQEGATMRDRNGQVGGHRA